MGPFYLYIMPVTPFHFSLYTSLMVLDSSMGGSRTSLILICITHFFAINAQHSTPRQALQIIIGGGDDTPPPEYQNCPPPPPPPCPPPQPPPPPPCPPPPKISPPPPPPPSTPRPSPHPPPYVFENQKLKKAFGVIQAFKKTVVGDPLGIKKTWNGPNVCKYKGFTCDVLPGSPDRTLAGVKFNQYNFTGGGHDLVVTDLLLGLTDIVFFHANSNNFTGSIPAEICKRPFFTELDLSNNKFSGNFPAQVLGAKTLLFLDLRFNTFAGTVPPEVFLLKLDVLFINNNGFIQQLPNNLGSTTALYLTLANNKFIGGIPPSIGQASGTLLEVLFLNNQLTGCLPYEIGLLKKATVFDVSKNQLTGPIPHSFQCLKKMDLLNLGSNKFYGVVPEAVCSLPELSKLTLSYNYFTEVGPECRKLIKKGKLDVTMNCILDLPNQRSKADCASFFSAAHSCPDERSLTYIPCTGQYFDAQLDTQFTAPAPAQSLRGASYGALSPH